MNTRIERILILCKTYPSPSARYTETSCVAGMTDYGSLIRLYPMPFRLIGDDGQFKKWQWITARVAKATNDNRPESHRIFVDTIHIEGKPLSTADHWFERRVWIEKLNIKSDFNTIEAERAAGGATLALLRPAQILGLDITAAKSSDWSDDELAKLMQLQAQGELFAGADDETKSLRLLRKIPYDFHYRYRCETDAGPVEFHHKIVDWEIGALFWNVQRKHGTAWEQPFRDKMITDLPGKDLVFLMGNIHRFPDQWLIVSVVYPPRQRPEAERQGSLL